MAFYLPDYCSKVIASYGRYASAFAKAVELKNRRTSSRARNSGGHRTPRIYPPWWWPVPLRRKRNNRRAKTPCLALRVRQSTSQRRIPVPKGQATMGGQICKGASVPNTILLVQSEPLLRRAIARLLASMGHHVVTQSQVTDGATGPRPTCVVVDERDLFDVPPTATPVPHIVLTADPSPVRRSRGQSLQKPFTAEELRRAILEVGLPTSESHEDLPYSEFLSSVGVYLT